MYLFLYAKYIHSIKVKIIIEYLNRRVPDLLHQNTFRTMQLQFITSIKGSAVNRSRVTHLSPIARVSKQPNRIHLSRIRRIVCPGIWINRRSSDVRPISRRQGDCFTAARTIQSTYQANRTRRVANRTCQVGSQSPRAEADLNEIHGYRRGVDKWPCAAQPLNRLISVIRDKLPSHDTSVCRGRRRYRRRRRRDSPTSRTTERMQNERRDRFDVGFELLCWGTVTRNQSLLKVRSSTLQIPYKRQNFDFTCFSQVFFLYIF